MSGDITQTTVVPSILCIVYSMPSGSEPITSPEYSSFREIYLVLDVGFTSRNRLGLLGNWNIKTCTGEEVELVNGFDFQTFNMFDLLENWEPISTYARSRF